MKTPGKRLDDIRKELQLPKTALAEKLSIAPDTLYAVLKDKRRIDPRLASRLGELHKDAVFWLTLQHDFDVSQLTHQTEHR